MTTILSNRAISLLILRELRTNGSLAEAALRQRLPDVDQARITHQLRLLLADARIVRIGGQLLIPASHDAEAA